MEKPSVKIGSICPKSENWVEKQEGKIKNSRATQSIDVDWDNQIISMQVKSKKQKGNRYENWLIEDLRKTMDEKAHRTYGSGSGLDKNDINCPNCDLEIEAKNQKTLKVMDWWEQSQRQRTNRMTVVIFRNPRKSEFQENLVVMDYEEWKELIKGNQQEVKIESNYDPNLKWKMKRLRDAAQAVFKELMV